MPTIIIYTTTLEIRRETVERPALLPAAHRVVIGTCRVTWSLGPFKQAMLVVRWFLDGTRTRQLCTDNAISTSTAYAHLQEGIDVLAARAPDLKAVIERAQETGFTHLNLDGTVICTDRVKTWGPNGADLWWSDKHKHHGGNIQLYQIVATNIAHMWGIAGSRQPQWLDVLHRAHARVEDRVRTNKAVGLRDLPLKSWNTNTGWVLAANLAADLDAWTRLLGLHDSGDLASPAPCATGSSACPPSPPTTPAADG